MKIQNNPRTQFLIEVNTEISKWIHQGEQIIIMGDWNSEESEVNTWIEKQELTKKICNLQRYSDDLITY